MQTIMTKDEVVNQIDMLFVKSNGSLNHVVNREDFYISHGHEELLTRIIELTNTQSIDTPIRDRVRLLLSPFNECVVCSKPTIILNGKPSKVCSRTCACKLGKLNLDQSLITKKRNKTMLEKYGVTTNSQRKDITTSKSNLTHEKLKLLTDKEFIYNLHIVQKKSSVQIAQLIGVYYGTVIDYIRNKHDIDYQYYNHSSSYEDMISEYLDRLNIRYEKNNRSLLNGRELDFYIPEYSIAIEVNGIYWHSEVTGNKSRTYHFKKWVDCKNKGITLLTFTHDKLKHKFNIIKSIINHKLKFTATKVYARKCKVVEVDVQTAKDFLNRNHLQGYARSTIRYGLYYNNELVSIITFSKSRFRSDTDLELIRFCNKINTHVVGSASKLFNQVNEKSVVSYSMNDISDGNLYKSIGFNLIKINSAGYWYTQDGETLFHRSIFQKHKLSEKLHSFDANLSEWENMQLAGWDRYWDTGTMTWMYTPDKKIQNSC